MLIAWLQRGAMYDRNGLASRLVVLLAVADACATRTEPHGRAWECRRGHLVTSVWTDLLECYLRAPVSTMWNLKHGCTGVCTWSTLSRVVPRSILWSTGPPSISQTP